MPMADGKYTLKKIAFQIGDKMFRFAINPGTYQHAKPHRTTALKTKSRIIIEDFQSDIPTITIGGTTGFNPTGRAEDRGIAKIKEMKEYLESYAEMGGNGSQSSEDFYFHNFTNDESYVVHLSPEGVTFTQDEKEPLLHRYQIKFIVLRKATEPADDDVINPEIGNRFPSIPNGVATPLPSPYQPHMEIQTPGSNSSNTRLPLPSPTPFPLPYPTTGGTGGGVYDPILEDDTIYNPGTAGQYIPSAGSSDPVNPQAPSFNSYQYGMYGLGFTIGYYGRGYK